LKCSKGNVDEATEDGDIAVVAEVIDDGTDSHVGDLLVRLCLGHAQLSSWAGGCDDESADGKLGEMHDVDMNRWSLDGCGYESWWLMEDDGMLRWMNDGLAIAETMNHRRRTYLWLRRLMVR
jgi:hypothetical protein